MKANWRRLGLCAALEQRSVGQRERGHECALRHSEGARRERLAEVRAAERDRKESGFGVGKRHWRGEKNCFGLPMLVYSSANVAGGRRGQHATGEGSGRDRDGHHGGALKVATTRGALADGRGSQLAGITLDRDITSSVEPMGVRLLACGALLQCPR